MWYRSTFAVGLVLLMAAGADAQTPRILVTGDSWAEFPDDRWFGQFLANGWLGSSAVNTGIGGMASVLLSTPDLLQSRILGPLAANPTIDMVHLSIGGIDLLGSYHTGLSPQQLAANNALIQSNVQSIVDRILAVRPTMQVTIVGYDYLNFVDTLGFSGPQAVNTLLWLNMGQPLPGPLNRAVFGDQAVGGGQLGMEDYKEQIAQGSSRVHYYNIEGAMQRDVHGFSTIELPSPKSRMGANGADAIHLNDRGWDILIDTGFNAFYNNQLRGGLALVNPGAGGTLDVGAVLVGRTGSASATATNVGGAGSRLDVAFAQASGEFAGGSATQHAFFSQYTGGDTLAQPYTYTPSARGIDSQNLSIQTSNGTFPFTLRGNGVAPVQAASATDAGPVRVGAAGEARVHITNVGDGNLSGAGQESNLSGTVGIPNGSPAFAGGGQAVSLGDGQGHTASFAFAPSERGAASAVVELSFANGHANGTNAAQTVSLQIAGVGVGPVFSASAANIDFGPVAAGQYAARALEIRNLTIDEGAVELTGLTLLDYSISGAGASHFTLADWTHGVVLERGSSPVALGVEFSSFGPAGLQTATLHLATDQGVPFGAVGTTFDIALSALIPAAAPGLLVASAGSRQVVGLDADGTASVVAGPPQGLLTPVSIAVSASGERFVADWANTRIVRLDAAGNATVVADQAKGVFFPTSVAADAEGGVLAANYALRQIVAVNASGQPTILSDATKGLAHPFTVAVGPEGTVYVAEPDDRRIVALGPEGIPTVFADASDGLLSPIGLTFDANGDLLVADLFGQKVFRFGGDGVGSVLADASDGIGVPSGIAVDEDGNVYVADFATGKVHRIAPDGATSVFASPQGLLKQPFGLALDRPAPSDRWAAARVAAVPEANGFILAAAGLAAALLFRRRSAPARRSPKGAADGCGRIPPPRA